MRYVVWVLGLLLLISLAGIGVTSDHYGVSASPEIDTPTRTVTFEGDDFEISQLGRVDPGGEVQVSVNAPDNEAYGVSLYDADRQAVDEQQSVGSDSFTFSTEWEDGSTYEPGTYVFAVEDNGIQAVTPLVIVGYRAEVDAPTRAKPGSEVSIETHVTTVDDSKPIDRVRAVIGNDDRERRVNLSPQGDGNYTATITIDTLPEGDYSLYAVVQGSEQVLGRQEVLGTSDPQDFEITSSPETTTPTESDGSSNGGGGAGGPTGSDTPTDSPVTTEPPTTTVTPTLTDSESGESTVTEPNDDVITPNPPTTDETSTPGQSLGLLPPVLALLTLLFLVRWRV